MGLLGNDHITLENSHFGNRGGYVDWSINTINHLYAAPQYGQLSIVVY